MKPKDITVRILKKAYRLLAQKQFYDPECVVDRQLVNDKIYELLIQNQPTMIARFGTVELNCINNYLCVKSDRNHFKKIHDYITDKTHTPWWYEPHYKSMNILSGIFPPSKETSEKFSERYLKDIPLIDLLGSFQYYEKFMPLSNNLYRGHLETLYPFFVDRPWTLALEDKKVLVVHPFEESIKKQYSKRELLFNDKNVLPNFELITMKSVQSAAGSKVHFKDWFEALEYMERKISAIDFDICILGCGGYGLPLAAHVKRLGKKSVHMGGGTQLMFGIKGKRWEQQYENELTYRFTEKINTNYKSLFNKDWIYPEALERPINAEAVEGACYW